MVTIEPEPHVGDPAGMVFARVFIPPSGEGALDALHRGTPG
jgi:hypothetical protein